jgi:hypothetical protein
VIAGITAGLAAPSWEPSLAIYAALVDSLGARLNLPGHSSGALGTGADDPRAAGSCRAHPMCVRDRAGTMVDRRLSETEARVLQAVPRFTPS